MEDEFVVEVAPAILEVEEILHRNEGVLDGLSRQTESRTKRTASIFPVVVWITSTNSLSPSAARNSCANSSSCEISDTKRAMAGMSYTDELLQRKERQPKVLVCLVSQLLCRLARFSPRRIHQPDVSSINRVAYTHNTAGAHLRLTLLLIFFRRFSLVTSSSVSSLSAKFLGGSLIFKLRQSCFITSSTVRVGSMRVLTVRPSAVVTLFVGTSVDLDTDPLEKLEGSRLGAPDITSD